MDELFPVPGLHFKAHREAPGGRRFSGNKPGVIPVSGGDMTRPKMTGECTVQEFWIEVAHFGWGTKTTDFRAIKREILRRYDDVFLKNFQVP